MNATQDHAENLAKAIPLPLSPQQIIISQKATMLARHDLSLVIMVYTNLLPPHVPKTASQ